MMHLHSAGVYSENIDEVRYLYLLNVASLLAFRSF